MAVEIAALAHLGPGRVDAQRDDGEGEVDDPDAEVFAGMRGEFDRMAFLGAGDACRRSPIGGRQSHGLRSEEHTSELQSRQYLVCRLLLAKKKQQTAFKSTSCQPKSKSAPI